MTVLPYSAVAKMLDKTENDLKNEYADAKERMAICKEKRIWWQLITLRILRKRLERLKVEI